MCHMWKFHKNYFLSLMAEAFCTYCTIQVYSFDSYKRSLPSLIGLKCETGIIDDCNLSLPEEVLPFSCKGIHMFADKTYNECGSQCKLFNKSNSAIKKGWTKYVRFQYLLLFPIFVSLVLFILIPWFKWYLI